MLAQMGLGSGALSTRLAATTVAEINSGSVITSSWPLRFKYFGLAAGVAPD